MIYTLDLCTYDNAILVSGRYSKESPKFFSTHRINVDGIRSSVEREFRKIEYLLYLTDSLKVGYHIRDPKNDITIIYGSKNLRRDTEILLRDYPHIKLIREICPKWETIP